MQDAYYQQQTVAPEIQENCAPASCGGAVDEENHSRAEEQREQSHELLVDENLTEYAHRSVEPGLGAARAQVQVWWQTELERYSVHQQYAEHAAAAYEVEAGNSRGFAYRA